MTGPPAFELDAVIVMTQEELYSNIARQQIFVTQFRKISHQVRGEIRQIR